MLIVSPLVKMHICKRAKEHNIKYINGMEDVLQKFIQMPQMNGYNLAFSEGSEQNVKCDGEIF